MTKATNGVFTQTLGNLLKLRDLSSTNQKITSLVTTSTPNNCVQTTTGDILCVKCVEGEFVKGFKMDFVKPLYTEPYLSQTILFGYYCRTDTLLEQQQFCKKCICFPCQNDLFIIMPFCTNIC